MTTTRRSTQRSLAAAFVLAVTVAAAGCGSGERGASADGATAGGSASATTPGQGSDAATTGGSPPSSAAASTTPPRGSLLAAPTPLTSVDAARIDADMASKSLTTLIARATPCNVSIARIRYQTIGGAGEPTTASAAVMTPSGSDPACNGPRPVVLYARGTATERSRALTDPGDGETGSVIAFFAGQGMIVVAPSYTGYDGSDLPYHPYLNANAQSADMIDAWRAARGALPALGASPSSALFVTGYSQGGYVAMATHRAIEADPSLGITVTASGPMSGPYSLTHFLSTAFGGIQPGGATVYMSMLIDGFQRSYGNVYASPSEVYAAPYDTVVPGLLPSDDPTAKPRLPAGADGSYRSLFDAGDGQPFLLTAWFRSRAFQPGDPFAADVQRNDLLDWTPRAPMALCYGANDPVVFGFNASDAQAAFAGRGARVTRWDLEDAATLGAEHATLKRNFDATKALVALSAGGGQDGDRAVAERYHTGLVAPYCLSLVKDFFEKAAGG